MLDDINGVRRSKKKKKKTSDFFSILFFVLSYCIPPVHTIFHFIYLVFSTKSRCALQKKKKTEEGKNKSKMQVNLESSLDVLCYAKRTHLPTTETLYRQ